MYYKTIETFGFFRDELENLTWRQGKSSLINVVCSRYWRAVGNMPIGLLFGRTTFRSRHTPDFYVQSGAFCLDVFYHAKLLNINHILSQTLVSFEEINWKDWKSIRAVISPPPLSLSLCYSFQFCILCNSLFLISLDSDPNKCFQCSFLSKLASMKRHFNLFFKLLKIQRINLRVVN